MTSERRKSCLFLKLVTVNVSWWEWKVEGTATIDIPDGHTYLQNGIELLWCAIKASLDVQNLELMDKVAKSSFDLGAYG